MRAPLQARFESWSEQGYRVLGVAVRDVTDDPIIDKDDEQQMTFIGFVLLEDPAEGRVRSTPSPSSGSSA